MKSRTARWVAGCVTPASVLLIGGALALAYADRHQVAVSQSGWPAYLGQQVQSAAVPVAALVLVSRRPANRIGWLFLAAGLAAGLNAFADQYARFALIAHRGPVGLGRAMGWLSNATWLIPVALLVFLFLLFPTGRLHSRRWRGPAWLVGVAFAITEVGQVIDATRSWADPFGSSGGGPASVLDGMTAVLVSGAVLVSVAALVVRFARSVGEERLQLKWCALAAALLAAAFLALIWVNTALVNVLESLAFMGLWAAIAVAVLKYRLYEIDRIISRTLAYAIVTGLLVGVYAGLVLLATGVLRFHTPVAVAAATLIAAALFAPLRRRVQHAVDHRFNRARYDAEQTVATFATRLQDEVNAKDLDLIADDLAAAVDRSLAPAHISVWLTR